MDLQPPSLPKDQTSDASIDLWALFAVIFGIAGVGLALSLSLPLLSVVAERRGIDAWLIGVNTATAGIAAIAVLPFVTPLAQRIGTIALILVSTAVMTVSLLGFYFVESFILWFPLRFLFSAAVTAIFVLTEFWINTLAPDHRRGLIIGIYTASLSFGIALGPLLLAFIGTEGLLPFAVGGAMLAFAGLPFLGARRSEPYLARKKVDNLLRFVGIAPLALAAAVVFGAVESGGAAILPLYGKEIGFPEAHAVAMVSVVALGNILSQVPIGYLADRVSHRLLLVGCGAVGVVGAAFLPFVSESYVALNIVLFITGGIVAGLYTIGLVNLGSRFRGNELASANAAFVMMYGVGMLIGPVILGAGLDLYTPHGFSISITLIFAVYVAMGMARIGQVGMDRA